MILLVVVVVADIIVGSCFFCVCICLCVCGLGELLYFVVWLFC